MRSDPVWSGQTPERDVSCTRLWDETSQQPAERRKPSGGCDRLRTELAGTWEPPHEWTHCRDVAKRAETPAGIAPAERREQWLS
jgi:hypothetical protein